MCGPSVTHGFNISVKTDEWHAHRLEPRSSYKVQQWLVKLRNPLPLMHACQRLNRASLLGQ